MGIRNSYVVNGQRFACKRRALRIDIQRGGCPVYVNYPELSPHKFPVSTLAELGARYSTKGMRVTSLKGHTIAARLFFGPIQTPVKTRMVHVDALSAALEFVEPSAMVTQMIRNTFEVELTAAALMPFHNFTGVVPYSTHSTVYSDGETNLELFFHDEHLVALSGTLPLLEVRFLWSRKTQEGLRVIGLRDDHTQGPHLRRQLVSFVHNLQDLHPTVMSSLEKLFLGRAH